MIEIINNSQNVAENLKHDTPNMSKNHQIKSPFPHKGDESPKIIEIEKSSLIHNPVKLKKNKKK